MRVVGAVDVAQISIKFDTIIDLQKENDEKAFVNANNKGVGVNTWLMLTENAEAGSREGSGHT